MKAGVGAVAENTVGENRFDAMGSQRPMRRKNQFLKK
jgi:hypothetical protein